MRIVDQDTKPAHEQRLPDRLLGKHAQRDARLRDIRNVGFECRGNLDHRFTPKHGTRHALHGALRGSEPSCPLNVGERTGRHVSCPRAGQITCAGHRLATLARAVGDRLDGRSP